MLGLGAIHIEFGSLPNDDASISKYGTASITKLIVNSGDSSPLESRPLIIHWSAPEWPTVGVYVTLNSDADAVDVTVPFATGVSSIIVIVSPSASLIEISNWIVVFWSRVCCPGSVKTGALFNGFNVIVPGLEVLLSASVAVKVKESWP